MSNTEEEGAPRCLVCDGVTQWSSYGELWRCDNFIVCGSSETNMGASRWFCRPCGIDICSKCHPTKARTSDQGAKKEKKKEKKDKKETKEKKGKKETKTGNCRKTKRKKEKKAKKRNRSDHREVSVIRKRLPRTFMPN